MDELADATPTTRIGGRDPAPGRIVALVLVAVAIAVLKPWAGETPASPAGRAESPSTSRPPASAGPRTAERADLRLHCLEPINWRVYAHQSWKRGHIRTWRSLQPATAATGPLDDRLPVTRVPETVTALGYCAPWEGGERPPDDAELTVWLVLESDAREAVAALRLVHLAPEEDTTLGGLYEPAEMGLWFGDPYAPTSPAPTPAPWPANRYVFALRAEGWERWWIVRVGGPAGRIVPPGGEASARPAR